MTTAETEGKVAWTRCPKCKQRLWNDPIDIAHHAQRCPADLERALKNLRRDLESAIGELAGRVAELESHPVAHVIETEAGPSLDFEHEAPWPDEAVEVPEVEEDDVPIVAAQPLRSRYFDEEEDEPSPVTPLR